jgi:hypothetical protein
VNTSKRKTISRKYLVEVVDQAGGVFKECWHILESGRRKDTQKSLGEGLLEFQELLGDALQRLEQAYRLVNQEQELRIANKGRVTKGWFVKRMSLLKELRFNS